jgi:hypothetical protein
VPVALDDPELVVVAGAGVVRLRFSIWFRTARMKPSPNCASPSFSGDARGELLQIRDFRVRQRFLAFPLLGALKRRHRVVGPDALESPGGRPASARRPRREQPPSIVRRAPDLELARRPRSRRRPDQLQARERRTRVPGVVRSSRPPVRPSEARGYADSSVAANGLTTGTAENAEHAENMLLWDVAQCLARCPNAP